MTKGNKYAEKHGLRYTTEYKAWNSMMGRCYYEKGKSYHRYGGRGIEVCKQWRTSPKTFVADMGKKPSPKHSLDRRDNDGNYTPDNCRWSTPKRQQRNTSNLKYFYKGTRRTVSNLARFSQVTRRTISRRLKQGWTVIEAVETNSQQRRH